MKRSGQMLLIGILILAVLALLIPVMVMTTRSIFNRQVHDQQQENLNEIVPAAFQTVQYLFLQNPDFWKRALQGDPLQDAGLDGSKTFVGLKETPYIVICSTGSQSQTVEVTVQVKTAHGAVSAARLFRETFARKTFGVDLPMQGHVPAAVYLLGAYPPLISGGVGQLNVHWGPIVSFAALALPDDTDDDQHYGFHPRKICAGPYQRLKSSENAMKEVWQNIPLGQPVAIDQDSYIALAHQDQIPDPKITSELRSAYFEPGDSGRAFTAGLDYTVTTGTDAVVVSGDAIMGQQGMDLDRGAMIVTGNAAFTGRIQRGLPLMLRVPAQASREYPYITDTAAVPCAGQTTCEPTDLMGRPVNVDFRGFLYVLGNLAVLRDTVLAGVLRVDGTLYIARGKHLTVYYDDSVGRSIATTNLQIEQLNP